MLSKNKWLKFKRDFYLKSKTLLINALQRLFIIRKNKNNSNLLGKNKKLDKV
jgi:hypothetical protein